MISIEILVIIKIHKKCYYNVMVLLRDNNKFLTLFIFILLSIR